MGFLTDVLVTPTAFIDPYAEDFIITLGNSGDLSASIMVYNFLAGPEVTLKHSSDPPC